MDSIQEQQADEERDGGDGDQSDSDQELRAMIQASVQMPRFIRVNSKTTGSFVKLKGKPFQSTQS